MCNFSNSNLPQCQAHQRMLCGSGITDMVIDLSLASCLTLETASNIREAIWAESVDFRMMCHLCLPAILGIGAGCGPTTSTSPSYGIPQISVSMSSNPSE